MVSDQPAREASTAEPTVVAHENGQLAYTEYGDADGVGRRVVRHDTADAARILCYRPRTLGVIAAQSGLRRWLFGATRR